MSSSNISYARARLLLGVFGVGSIVVTSLALIVTGMPERILPTAEVWQWQDPLSLAAFIGIYICVMMPLDFWGGYYLPRRYGRASISLRSYLGDWVRGTTLQAAVFFVSGMLLLAAGRSAGLLGVAAMLLLIMVACLYLQQNHALAEKVQLGQNNQRKLDAALLQLDKLGLRPIPVAVRSSRDVGFTGGIVGMPGRETSIVPERWINLLSVEELSVVLARRSVAVSSESRSRGILLAIGWCLSSFILSASLWGVEIVSVASLVTVLLGAALFTFLGLLILPMISRQSSYQIDQQVADCGVAAEALTGMIEKLDRLQDNEPERSPIIESIFHPIPSVANRKSSSKLVPAVPTAWHAARMTIFLSWASVGLLSRAVHCNVGRPDLWLMLPTD